MFENFGQQLYDNLIGKGRFKLYLEGFGNTLFITTAAAIIGILIGSIVAIAKVFSRNNTIDHSKHSWIWKIINAICDIYITIIRGTPSMVQLMIFAFVIFSKLSMSYMIYVSALAFGINSGAYVAEIVRAGIQAVSKGQMEAGRSLGLTNGMTMRMIIIPQAIKNVLPALGNEAVTLLKETSIVGYISVSDITYAASLVRSRTFSPIPLIFIALVYLCVVMLLSWLFDRMERRLAVGDKR